MNERSRLRIEGKEGQPDSGPAIVRFRGVDRPIGGGPSTSAQNKRLKWDGTNWVYDDGPTEEHNTKLYDGDDEKRLGVDEEVFAVWRSPAKRWQILSAPTPTIFLGLTTAAVSGSGNFQVKVIRLISGSDPRDDPDDVDETVDVKNTFGLSMGGNVSVWCQADSDGGYETFRPGGGGTGGGGSGVGSGSLVFFELTQDLSPASPFVTAVLLDEFGTPLAAGNPFDLTVTSVAARLSLTVGTGSGEVQPGDIVKQSLPSPQTYWRLDTNDATDLDSWSQQLAGNNVRVLNQTFAEGRLYGFSSYTNALGDAERGFFGTGYVVTFDHQGSGVPAVLICNLDSQANSCTVKLEENISGVGTYRATLQGIGGTNFDYRMPKQTDFPQSGGGNDTGIEVWSLPPGLQNAKKGELWECELATHDDNFPAPAHYTLKRRTNDYVLLVGKARADWVEGETTVEVEQLDSMIGPVPIDIAYVVAKLEAEQDIKQGDTVYAFHDRNLANLEGDNLDEQWRVTSAFDFPVETTGGGTVDIDIVLIDEDIDGAEENDPQQFAEASDIPLTAQEVTDGYTVVFEDPPGTTVSNLPLTSYTRTIVELKYYEGSPINGTADGAGGVDTITLAVGSSSTDDFHVDDAISVNGETKNITGYVGATRVATVASDWATPPVDADPYVINSSKNLGLAKEIIDDAANKKKIVRHKTKSIRYDDGKPFLLGEYTRSDYPNYPENSAFPPPGLDPGFLNRKFRGVAINGVLITVLCKALPPPELP